MEPDLRYSYQDEIQAIYNKYNINEVGVNKIKDINKTFKKKTLTEDGRDRKQRIVEKLIYKHKSLLFISNSYATILPVFKSMVFVFEQKESQVHKLYDMMVNTLRSFLACFIRYEIIKNLSGKRLKKVNILDNVRQPRSFLSSDNNQFTAEISAFQVYLFVFVVFFYQGFLLRTLTTHRTAAEGRGPFSIPLDHFHPLTNIQTFMCNSASEMTITYF